MAGGIGAVAVEPTYNRVMLYSPRGAGTDLGRFDQAGEFLPSSIRRTPDDHFVLKLGGNSFIVLDEALQLDRALDPALNPADTRGITSIYDWAVTNDWLFGFGSVRDVKVPERYRLGFLMASLDSLDKPKLALEVDEGEIYLYNQPYFAAIGGDRGYFVRFSEGMTALYSIDRDGAIAEVKGAIPQAYRRAPVVTTPNRGPDSAPAIYAELEKQRFVAGLFNIDGRLFLLTRRPYMGTRTLWKMYEVDLKSKAPLQPALVLPTFAPHIAFVPTRELMLIFEKGRVYGGGSQQIGSIKTFGADWLLTPKESPLQLRRMEESLVRCEPF